MRWISLIGFLVVSATIIYSVRLINESIRDAGENDRYEIVSIGTTDSGFTKHRLAYKLDKKTGKVWAIVDQTELPVVLQSDSMNTSSSSSN